MGSVKNEWISHQEQEGMYDWIEENYGDDAGEEGSSSWNEAVQDFERRCENKHRLEQEMFLQEQYDYYLSLSLLDADFIFQKDIFELKSMLENTVNGLSNHTFIKMAYAHAVTILEVYLEDVSKALVMSNEKCLENTIKNVRPFRDTKFKLGDISLENDGIRKFVIGKLSENLFHDIPKVMNILSSITGKRLDLSVGDICNVTSVRHDIVHRNGKNKDGELIDIGLDSTLDALNTIVMFVKEVRHELSEL